MTKKTIKLRLGPLAVLRDTGNKIKITLPRETIVFEVNNRPQLAIAKIREYLLSNDVSPNFPAVRKMINKLFPTGGKK